MPRTKTAFAIALLTLSAPAFAIGAKSQGHNGTVNGSAAQEGKVWNFCPPANIIPIMMGRTPNFVFIDGCS